MEVIIEFAPDNSNAALTIVPEPKMFGLVRLGMVALYLRRRLKI